MTHSAPSPNPSQQKAIESIHGQVMLLAGPGTGKTFTLTERIVHLLKRNIRADRILALTFTENAAAEMKERLEQRLGLIARRVSVSTFHGFCQRLIQHHPDIFEVSADVQVLDAVTRFEIIRNALEKHEADFLKTERGDRFYYVREIIDKISVIKREAIRAEKFQSVVLAMRQEAEALKESAQTKTAKAQAERMFKQAGRLAELWEIYEAYNAELERRNLTDFDDMLLRVSEAFRNQPDFLESIRNQYEFLHADEFQDNNSAQNEILYGIAGEDPHLFVVGDDDQSIFRFQGACSENFTGFLQRFPKAEVLTLNKSHRSTPSILHFAHSQISLGSHRLESEAGNTKLSKRLSASHPSFKKLEIPVRLVACASSWDESEWIAGEILRLRDADPSLEWSHFAVLFRMNREAQEIGSCFKRRKIPFRVGNSDDGLMLPSTQNLLAILRAIAKPQESIPLSHAMLFPPFGIPFSDTLLMQQAARAQQIPLWKILETDLSQIPLNQPEKMLSFRALLARWRTLFFQRNLYHAFLDVLHESQILGFHFHPALPFNDSESTGTNRQVDSTALKAIQSLAQMVERFTLLHPAAPLESWLHHVELMELYRIPLKIPPDDAAEGDSRVQLLTIHKAKGSEFRAIFVSNTCASNWEERRPRRDLIPIPPELVLSAASLRKTSTESRLEIEEDERRLMYVAATRARERLYLTRPLWREDRPLEESILLAPLKEFKPLPATWEEIPPLPDPDRDRYQLASPLIGKAEPEFIRERLQKIRISPTNLHQYQTCPRQFLYSQVYMVPSKPSAPLAYGSAVHEALRHFFSPLKRDPQWPPLEKLLRPFLDALKRQTLENAREYEQLEHTGRKELTAFYEWCRQNPPPAVAENELAIRKVALESVTPEKKPHPPISLSGRFDRVDHGPNGSWTVVDYKTGRPRSENDFFGRNKDSDGQYWDQFRFYKLLNEHSKDQKPIQQGHVIYIQDPERSHAFELTSRDAEEIRHTIEEVHTRIHALDFHPLSETQSAEACEHCSYVGLCKAGF